MGLENIPGMMEAPIKVRILVGTGAPWIEKWRAGRAVYQHVIPVQEVLEIDLEAYAAKYILNEEKKRERLGEYRVVLNALKEVVWRGETCPVGRGDVCDITLNGEFGPAFVGASVILPRGEGVVRVEASSIQVYQK